jgi:hypothetical protein
MGGIELPEGVEGGGIGEPPDACVTAGTARSAVAKKMKNRAILLRAMTVTSP